MTGLLAALGVLGGLGMTAIGDMVSEEVRDRLDHVPEAILHLAARRLDPTHRSTLYEEVWLPDLAYFLKGDEARPVTRLIHGTWYALGILWSARRIASHFHLEQAALEQRLVIRVLPEDVYVLGGRTWSHEEFRHRLDTIVERQEESLANTRSPLSRRRARERLRAFSSERDRIVGIMQARASGSPRPPRPPA